MEGFLAHVCIDIKYNFTINLLDKVYLRPNITLNIGGDIGPQCNCPSNVCPCEPKGNIVLSNLSVCMYVSMYECLYVYVGCRYVYMKCM